MRVKADRDARSLLDPPPAESELGLGLSAVTVSCLVSFGEGLGQLLLPAKHLLLTGLPSSPQPCETAPGHSCQGEAAESSQAAHRN